MANFQGELSDLVRTDGAMQLQTKVQARWQRKNSTSGLSPSRNSINKTPTRSGIGMQNVSKSGQKKGEAANSRSGKKVTRTPGKENGDRFIADRKNLDFEYGHYAVMKQMNQNDEDDVGVEKSDQKSLEYQERLKDAMNVKDRKILNFRTKCPTAKNPTTDNLAVLYSGSMGSAAKPSAARHIPQEPERVLDAPDLLDDYYLNLLAWSSGGVFAVGLGTSVYLWQAESGEIAHLLELSGGQYVSSLAWVAEGAVLAVGVSGGTVQLWDCGEHKLMRSMAGHAGRVGALAWNQHILSSGSRTGAVHHHDVRVAQHQVATLEHHTQEVCGLAWSPGGVALASGANDNMVHIWGMGQSSPTHSLSQHQAAVKALAWCPWQPHLLASGGGTADRHIRLWNTQTGAALAQTDTGSQVSSLLWSEPHKELVSGHGFSLNHLRIWKYPSMARVTDLVGHTGRILSLALSPDGTTVASAAADETIRLWKCFDVPKRSKKVSKAKDDRLTSDLSKMCIR